MRSEVPSEKICEWILEYFLYAKLSTLAEEMMDLLSGLTKKRIRDFENKDLQKRFLINFIRGSLSGGNQNALSKIVKVVEALDMLEKITSKKIMDKLNEYFTKYEVSLNNIRIRKEQEDEFLKSGDCNKCLKMINEYLEYIERNTRSPILKIIERDIKNGLYIPLESIVVYPSQEASSSQVEQEKQVQSPAKEKDSTKKSPSKPKKQVMESEIKKIPRVFRMQLMAESSCTETSFDNIRNQVDEDVKKFAGNKRTRTQLKELRKSSKELKEKSGDALSEALEQLSSQESQQSSKGKQPKKKRKILPKEKQPISDDEEEEETEKEQPRTEENEEESDELINDPEFDLPEVNKKEFKESLGSIELTKSGRRKKIFWTEEEIKNLEKGVKLYGEGRWTLILRRFKFNPARDATSLRDKWRILSKKKK